MKCIGVVLCSLLYIGVTQAEEIKLKVDVTYVQCRSENVGDCDISGSNPQDVISLQIGENKLGGWSQKIEKNGIVIATGVSAAKLPTGRYFVQAESISHPKESEYNLDVYVMGYSIVDAPRFLNRTTFKGKVIKVGDEFVQPIVGIDAVED